ncbi:unnamed protein product [Cylindrotheca closterium]|uniref:Uncharacterized protein n=1 Tax=Cylindrotheca closterium TaxID=2856 RepID=A0AAD2CYY5_9STRA|nr:unnamed protein product [Cylindrotheca closterium]
MGFSHEDKMRVLSDPVRQASRTNSDDDNSPILCPISLHENRRSSKKRVRWDRVHKREFSLIVGDHPLCHDGLPVSFGWQYSDCRPDSLVNASERIQSYVFPRRMSYDERRQLLFSGGLSADQVKSDEIDLIVRTLSEVWDTSGMANMDGADPLAEIEFFGDDDMPINMDIDLGDISNFEWSD